MNAQPLPSVQKPMDESMKDRWHASYAGAFLALGIRNLDAVDLLLEFTRSTDDVVQAIETLRTSREGDRVYPALELLQSKRGLR